MEDYSTDGTDVTDSEFSYITDIGNDLWEEKEMILLIDERINKVIEDKVNSEVEKMRRQINNLFKRSVFKMFSMMKGEALKKKESYHRNYYLENKDKIKKYQKKYYLNKKLKTDLSTLEEEREDNYLK